MCLHETYCMTTAIIQCPAADLFLNTFYVSCACVLLYRITAPRLTVFFCVLLFCCCIVVSFLLNLLCAVFRIITRWPDHRGWYSIQRSNHHSGQRGPAPRASRGMWPGPRRVQGVDGGVLAHIPRRTPWLWRRRQDDRRDSTTPSTARHSRIFDVIYAAELCVSDLRG